MDASIVRVHTAELYELQVRIPQVLAGERCAMAKASSVVQYIERGNSAMN
jgi:hypothetical protein